MLQLQDVAVQTRLFVLRREGELLDHVRGELPLGEGLPPVGRGLPPEGLLQHAHQLQAVLLAALVVAVEAGIGGVEARDLGQPGPPAVRVGHRQRHPQAVLGEVEGAAHRVARVHPVHRLGQALSADGEIGLEVEARAVHVAREERHVDLLPLPGLLAVAQGGDDAEGQHDAGVHLARAREDRRLAGLREDRHHARARGGKLVQRRPVPVGPLGPEARGPPVDEARLERGEGGVVPALRVEGRQGTIRDEDIGLTHEPAQDLASFLLLEVEREAQLVAVHELGLVGPGRARNRAVTAARAGLRQVLHADHLGAEVPEQGRAERRPELRRPVQDDDSFECLAHVDQSFTTSRVLSMGSSAPGSERRSHSR